MTEAQIIEMGVEKMNASQSWRIIMKKSLLGLCALGVVVLIACEVAKNNQAEPARDENTNPAAGTPKIANPHASPLLSSEEPPAEAKPIEPMPPNENKPPKEPITQFDSKKLDDQVREMAAKLGQDPNTFRMPVRTDLDGAVIYRMLGMHVITHPHNEEVFLPDEI